MRYCSNVCLLNWGKLTVAMKGRNGQCRSGKPRLAASNGRGCKGRYGSRKFAPARSCLVTQTELVLSRIDAAPGSHLCGLGLEGQRVFNSPSAAAHRTRGGAPKCYSSAVLQFGNSIQKNVKSECYRGNDCSDTNRNLLDNKKCHLEEIGGVVPVIFVVVIFAR